MADRVPARIRVAVDAVDPAADARGLEVGCGPGGVDGRRTAGPTTAALVRAGFGVEVDVTDGVVQVAGRPRPP